MDRKRESALNKIRALAMKTVDRGCTEAEAKQAAEVMDRLLETYEVDLSELEVRSTKAVHVRVSLGADLEEYPPIFYAISGIGVFVDGRSWIEGARGKGAVVNYVALPVDAQIAEYMTWVCHRACYAEAQKWRVMNPAARRMTQREFLAAVPSFRIGVATRLNDRLREMRPDRDARVQAAGGQALVVVKNQAVAELFESLGIVFEKDGLPSQIKNRAAFLDGRKAGENVPLNQGIRQDAQAAASRERIAR